MRRLKVIACLSIAMLLMAMASSDQNTEYAWEEPSVDAIGMAPRQVATGESAIHVDIQFPRGYEMNHQAPSVVRVKDTQGLVTFDQQTTFGQSVERFPATIHASAKAGETTLKVHVDLYYCASREKSLCYLQTLLFYIPLQITEHTSNQTIEISHKVKIEI